MRYHLTSLPIKVEKYILLMNVSNKIALNPYPPTMPDDY